jgi:type VI secretion system secreted protein Hcp
MNDVIITSVTHGGSSVDNGYPENVSLAFAKVNLEYKPQNADGSMAAGVHFKYDIKGSKVG